MNAIQHPFGRAALGAALALSLCAGAQAQRVSRDATTGELRAPTAAEAKALEGSQRASQPKGLLTGRVAPAPVRQANGTVEQELDTSTLMHSVARKNADGSVSQYCVTGTQAANRILQASAQSQSRAPAISRAARETAYETK